MLFLSGFSIAQNLPRDVFGIRDLLLENGDSFQRIQYLTRSAAELCHADHDIADTAHRYVRIPSSGANIIGIGTDANSLTNYTVLGSFRSQPRTGFYGANTGGLLSSQINWNTVPRTRLAETDPTPCETRVTEIRDINFSGGDGIEVLSFHYTANEPSLFRVWVIDVANGNTPVRVANNREYYEFHGGTVDPVSFSVPQRQIGNVYEIRMAAVSDLDLVTIQEAPIVVGTRILSIDSRGLQFITASNNAGADNIWLDRIHRGDTPSRNRNRFKEGVTTKHWSRAGDKVRRYTISFSNGELYTYESIQLNTQRTGDSNRWVRQLNGPRVHFTWRNRASNDAWYSLNWRVELPPGWTASDISNPQVRMYSRGNDLPWTLNPDVSVSQMLNSHQTLTNWRYTDNEWELGVRFTARGRTYAIKLVDHISHNEDRRTSGTDRTGGLYNQVRNTGRNGNEPWNYDFYSNRNQNGGGHHPGRVHFENTW